MTAHDTANYPITVTIGYDTTEDRMFLVLYLQDGGSRKACISRRLLGMLMKSMGENISTTSTNASRTPNPSDVLQTEHIAAVVNRKSGIKFTPAFQLSGKSLFGRLYKRS